ncbi:MAG: dienelactone hydrolase family protein [Ilumatobacteraceae bacterium]
MSSRSIPAVVLAAVLVASCGDDDGVSDTVPAVSEAVTTAAPPTEAPPASEAPPPSATLTTSEVSTTEPPPTTGATTEAPSDAAGEVVCSPVTIETSGVTVTAERCEPVPGDAAPRPAAIVLNGCGGYEADSEITAATVRALAERGVVALRLDWLAAEPAPPGTYCEAGSVIAAVQPLLQAVVDGTANLRADPTTDPERIGTASYSLGALGVMAADLGGAGLTTVTPLQLTAAALLSYPDQLPTIPAAARDGLLPPLYLMTGEDDAVAPSAGAQALADAAIEGGTPVEVVLVPGQDHPWRGEAAIAAATAMAEFLSAALGT